MAPRFVVAASAIGLRRLNARFGPAGIAIIAVLSFGTPAHPDALSDARQAKASYVRAFREDGRIDPAVLAPPVPALAALIAASAGATRARALYELGSIQRMTNRFSQAAVTLAEAAN